MAADDSLICGDRLVCGRTMKENELQEGKMKEYKLLGADGEFYTSTMPGTYGGNSKAKIYGRLDCPAALSTIKAHPGSYEAGRVFFADEQTAIAAGYRPCGRCLRERYLEWKSDPQGYRGKYGAG